MSEQRDLTLKVLTNKADSLEPLGVLPFTGIQAMFGSSVGEEMKHAYRRLGFSRMLAEGLQIDPYRGEPWGLDNGAYGAWKRGEEFPVDTFRRRLDRALEVADERDAPPLFAVVPDLVNQGLDSLDYSLEWVEECRTKAPAWDWYLGVQNGFTRERLEPVLDQFDGLLLGGGDEMKATAGRWCSFAHENDMGFHYARCGTLKKIRHAFEIGADSFDSVFPVMNPNRFGQTITEFAMLHRRYFGGNGDRR